jgi:hypothetical protein
MFYLSIGLPHRSPIALTTSTMPGSCEGALLGRATNLASRAAHGSRMVRPRYQTGISARARVLVRSLALAATMAPATNLEIAYR